MILSKDTYPTPRIAAVQAAPVYFDRAACLDKIRSFTAKAKAEGADLVIFSESFIPGFPTWVHLHAPIDQRDLYEQLVVSAVEVPGPAFYELQKIARDNGVFLSVGVTEKDPSKSIGVTWNTNLIFDRAGNLIAHHRKLMPTWSEKLVWSFGDGSTLNVHETELGRIGMLICGENTNTLAKYALTSQGEQIHISTYPACFPTSRDPKGGQPYFDTLLTRACASSHEGKCFTAVVSQVIDDAGAEAISKGREDLKELLREQTYGGTFIVGPAGNIVSNVIKDNEEGIAIADCDISREISLKGIHDLAGSYQRPDVYKFTLNKGPLSPVYIEEETCPGGSKEFIPFTENEE